jgi:hypothetical protein
MRMMMMMMMMMYSGGWPGRGTQLNKPFIFKTPIYPLKPLNPWIPLFLRLPLPKYPLVPIAQYKNTKKEQK